MTFPKFYEREEGRVSTRFDIKILHSFNMHGHLFVLHKTPVEYGQSLDGVKPFTVSEATTGLRVCYVDSDIDILVEEETDNAIRNLHSINSLNECVKAVVKLNTPIKAGG